jgi:hypothetical protein
MKICRVCKLEKNLTEFNKKTGTIDGLQSECRECGKIRSRLQYEKNKPKMVVQSSENKNKRRAEYRSKFYAILSESCCVDCGNDNPLVLEFDHIETNEKIHGLSKMIHDGYAWEKIIKEIDKCVCRCANCHRIKTAKEQGWYKYNVTIKS